MRDGPPPASQGPGIFWYFVVVSTACSVAVCAFAYMAAGAEPDTESSMQLHDRSCSWRDEWFRLNPFGCLNMRFRKERIDKQSSPEGRRACRGWVLS